MQNLGNVEENAVIWVEVKISSTITEHETTQKNERYEKTNWGKRR